MCEKIEKQDLAALEIFSNEELKLLAGYHIFNVGQLLGATGGLKRVAVMMEMDHGDHKIQQLKAFILKTVLEPYGEVSEDYKRGLWKNGKDQG